MKKITTLIITICLLCSLGGCSKVDSPSIVATTLPVYTFTSILCEGTQLEVGRLITENVSCLHDYSLKVSQMRMIEGAQAVIISGAGLEDFMHDALQEALVIDASAGIHLLSNENGHSHEHAEHHDHSHGHAADPHYWLNPNHAKSMAENICTALIGLYPQYKDIFQENLSTVNGRLSSLQAYGEENLSNLSRTELITFHDGFAYLADAFHLEILSAIEEESGREASAAELKEMIGLVIEHDLPAVFVETNGSVSAADIISAETGCSVYSLDMAMSGVDYFESMYYNINALKEALK